MTPPPRYRTGDRIGGRYLVHQALMGGMGEVYLCLDLERNVPFALKTFQARYLEHPRMHHAFEQEVAIWVALGKHPNIVRCFYLKTFDKQPFMFLEWIAGDAHHGTDLRSWLQRGALDLHRALSFAMDICRGLRYAASKQPGIVHRDLKPENILITRGSVARITDFGLALLAQSADLALPDPGDHTAARQTTVRTGQVVGTPAYMAPEQWLGVPNLDGRTDIYALGCILYELLTGQRPFQARTLAGMRQQHLEAAFPHLPATNSVFAALDPLIGRCTAKQVAERLPTVDDLLQGLTMIYQQHVGEIPAAGAVSDTFTATDYYNRGLTYHALRRYTEACQDFSHVIDLTPLDAEAYADRGSAHYHLKQYAAALQDYTQALQIAPTNPRFYINRGSAYTALQQYEDALADYSRAIEHDPDAAEAYYNRGNTYYQLHRDSEALADYTEVIRIKPLFVSAYANRANAYASLQRFEEALADYTRVIQLEPAHTGAYFNRGFVYTALQRYPEALADFEQIIQRNPNDAQAYLYIGIILVNSNQPQQALSYFAQAAKLGDATAAHYVAQVQQML